MAQSVKLKRSSVVSNGNPKLPTAAQIEVGEIAINFAEGHETLSTKNSNNGIATFSSDAVLDRKYIASGAVVSAVSAITKTIEDNEYVVAQAFNNTNDRISGLEEAGFITGYTETDPTVPSWAKQSSKPTYTASEVGALSTATTYFDDAEYDSGTKRINFKKNNTVIDYIDATDFIKDGMVSSVTVSNGNLVITFNTEAGREDIELALTQIFNPNNYYDKTAADAKFLSAYTETDPIFTDSPAYGITDEDIDEWNDKVSNVRADWTELDSSSDSYIEHSQVVAISGRDESIWYGIRTEFIEDGCGERYFFPDGDALYFSNYTGQSGFNDIILTLRSVKNGGTVISANTQDYGVVKIGNFIDNNRGTISVSTGTSNTTVARGDHTHSEYATTGNLNTLSSSTVAHIANTTIHLPAVTSNDNGKVAMVVNGQWSAATPVTVYSGSIAPDNVLGNNGDIYLQTS